MSLTRLLLERFGLDVQLSPLPGEIDRNFALGDHVLKVHAGGTDAELLDLQDAAMEHVAARSLAVATPRLVRARHGDGCTTTTPPPWQASVAPSPSSTRRSRTSRTRASTGGCGGTWCRRA